MGNYELLIAAIEQVIKTNGNNEITGAILQTTLKSIVNSVGANATFAGVATPATNPGTPDQNVFYIASENGTYSNFGGVTLTDEVAILSNNNRSWVKTNTGLATQQQLSDIANLYFGNYIGFLAPNDENDLSQGFWYSTNRTYSFFVIPVIPGKRYKTTGAGRRVFLSEFNFYTKKFVAASAETWIYGDIDVVSPEDAKYLYLAKTDTITLNGINLNSTNIFYEIAMNKQDIANNIVRDQRVAILGDSYSTYKGFVTPDTNRCFYGDGGEEGSDLTSVTQTWWYQICETKKYLLEINNSYSGAPICNTGYSGGDATAFSFVTRMKNIGRPNIILIMGGTNDSWANVPIGEYVYSNWTGENLKSFRPAFAYMLNYLAEHHPNVKIYNIINSGLSGDITNSMIEICNHYKVKYVLLTDFSKPYSGHPGVDGMASIANQVLAIL